MKPKMKTQRVFDHTETGRNARAQRKGHGLSLREVAEEMNISGMYLSDLERGKRNWNPILVDAFNRSIDAAVKEMKKENAK